MMEYTIQRLGHHGDGIADGPLYAPLTLPDEVVTGQLDGDVLNDVRIIAPSDHRVKAPCRHFKSCGGCQLQHASDQFVADWKVNVVKNALNSHGLETDIGPIITSPTQSRRRATFAAKRTKSGSMAGFYRRASDIIIEVPNCILLDTDVLSGRSVAEDLARLGASRKAALAVLVTASSAGLDILVRNGKPLDQTLFQQLASLAEDHKLARLTWDDEVIATRLPPAHRFGAANVVPPPGAFLQATQHGETALTELVLRATKGARNVVDLFAGCGTFSLPLAQNASVHAVEGDKAMVRALDQGWRNSKGLKPLKTEVRDLFRRPLLPDELAKAEAIVLDPPRAGAEAQVAEIVKTATPQIAFVSCNPVTFARDAAVLVAAGYRLDWLRVVDQFRWSAHIELVASLSHSGR